MKKQTRKLVIISLSFMALTLFNCKKTENKVETNVKTNTEVKAKVNLKKDKTELQLDIPKINTTTNIKDVENTYKLQIKKTEAALHKLEKKQKKVTLIDIPNTPISIWYANKKPVKIECGVTGDTGDFDGVFQYYLKDGKVWFTDQIFAKYVFQDNELKYWLDENWNVNEIPEKDFKDAEKRIIRIVDTMIDQFK